MVSSDRRERPSNHEGGLRAQTYVYRFAVFWSNVSPSFFSAPA